MGKVFRIKLLTTKEQNKVLEKFFSVYRTFYNKALEVQLNNRNRVETREEQFMSLEDIDIQVNKLNLKFPFKFDMGIRASALIHAQKAFYTWWNLYLTNPKKPSIGESPRFISKAKEAPFFFTESYWKVNKNGIYISCLGYVRITERDYVPFGEYRNIELKMINHCWAIKLEANFEIEVEQIKPVIDSLEVFINYNGSLQIIDTEIPSILDGEKYSKRLKKLSNCQRRYEYLVKLRSQNTEELKKLKNSISFLESTLEKMRSTYFGSIANNILKVKPAEVILTTESSVSNELQNFASKEHRQARTLFLVKVLIRNLELHGVKVKLKGIEPSILN